MKVVLSRNMKDSKYIYMSLYSMILCFFPYKAVMIDVIQIYCHVPEFTTCINIICFDLTKTYKIYNRK